jgi:hypothetical protein
MLCSREVVVVGDADDGKHYMSSVSQLHASEMKDLLMNFMTTLNSTAGGEPNEAGKYSVYHRRLCWNENGADPAAAFTTAAKSDAPRPTALQKSKAAIGLKANDPVTKERKAADNNTRVGEVRW